MVGTRRVGIKERPHLSIAVVCCKVGEHLRQHSSGVGGALLDQRLEALQQTAHVIGRNLHAL